jgi:hypothetical protein
MSRASLCPFPGSSSSIQAGDLADAYRLTNQGADVGRTHPTHSKR